MYESKTLSGHKGPVHVAIYNSGSNYILSGGQDRIVRLWNVKSGNLIQSFGGHGYEVLGMACSPDNKMFASCGGDRAVLLWDVAAAQVKKRFSGHLGKINTVAFNDDATILASGAADMSIRLWDMRSQQHIPLQVLDQFRDAVTSIAIQGSSIVAGSVDGHVRTFDIRMGEIRTDLFDYPVTSVTLAPDYTRASSPNAPIPDPTLVLVTTLCSSSEGVSKIHILDLTSGEVLQSLEGHKNENYRCKASWGGGRGKNGTGKGDGMVVMGDETGIVRAWDVENGRIIFSSKASREGKAVLWTASNEKEDQFLTAGTDGDIKIWTRY